MCSTHRTACVIYVRDHVNGSRGLVIIRDFFMLASSVRDENMIATSSTTLNKMVD